MNILHTCLYMCTICMSGIYEFRRREVLDPLELELQAVVKSPCECWELNGSSLVATNALNY